MFKFLRHAINKINIPVQNISKESFFALIKNTKVLATCERRNRSKVFLNDKNQIIKITRPKRFVEIHRLLIKNQIKTVELHGFYRCKELNNLGVVIYQCMPGLSLRDYVRLHNDKEIIQRFIRYLNSMHRQKLYFRDGHIGNYLIREEDGDIALIDINSIKKGISIKKRVENILMILNHKEDQSFFKRYGRDKFVEEYLASSNLSLKEQRSFISLYQQFAKF